MGGNSPLKPLPTSLYIATNMSLKTVEEKGNNAQKGVAMVFDFNNDGKFDEKEAATFNSVRITQHSKNKYTIWQKNGDKDTATKLEGDFSNLKFAPNRDYNTPPKTKTVKAATNSQKSAATIAVEEFQGKGELKVETYPDGALKSKKFKSADGNTELTQIFYEDGTPKLENKKVWNGHSMHTTLNVDYYPNGKVRKHFNSPDYKLEERKEYYEDGVPKLENKKVRNGSSMHTTLNVDYYPNGKVRKHFNSPDYKLEERKEYYEDGVPKLENKKVWTGSRMHTTLNVDYYPNGKVRKHFNSPDYKLEERKEYYENGTLKSKIIREWNRNARLEKGLNGKYVYLGDWVEKTHIEYDEKGNVIDKAKVTK